MNSNYPYAQGLGGLLDKVKKVKDDVKKTKDEVDKTKKEIKENINEVKGVVGVTRSGTSTIMRDTTSRNNTSAVNNSVNNRNGTSSTIGVEQTFIKSIKIANTAGRTILISFHLYDGQKEIGINRKTIVCEGKDCVVDLGSSAYQEYYVFGTSGNTIKKNALIDKGDYLYEIQANYNDDGNELTPFSTIISNKSYNGNELKEAGLTVKIEKTAESDALLEAKAKRQQKNKDANDLTKMETITIVNAVGGKGKIYCILEVPNKHQSSNVKKIEFMLGENKGDKYIVKDLRLFGGYTLLTMPESEKAKDPQREGISYIPNSLSGNSMDRFQMADGITANVGMQ